MKYIRGFLMAWGMFCWIPCPYKQWREEDRRAQVSMLPLIGTAIGVIVSFCWWLLSLTGAGSVITGVLLTALYFLLTGFIHLDGFMDCSDAIMPRHPDMAERRRILKDSHSGAFAVISVCLMLLVFAGAMIQVADSFGIREACMLTVIFTTSRFMSSIAVITCKPMNTSQYAGAAGKSMGGTRDTIPAFIILIVVLGAAEMLISGADWHALIAEYYSNLTAVAVLLAAGICGYIDRKKLGGMNGDISGHMISTSEMFGMIAMALLI